MMEPSMVLSNEPTLFLRPRFPVSERSLSDELSAVRLSPSTDAYVSSRLGLPMVPFTTSPFTGTPPALGPPPGTPPPPGPPPVNTPGRITPFCFSSSDSTRYFSMSWTSAMLSRRSEVKRARSCWLGAVKTISTFLSPPGFADVSLIP